MSLCDSRDAGRVDGLVERKAGRTLRKIPLRPRTRR